MNPDHSYSVLRGMLKAAGRTLKSLHVPDAVEFMFAFYRDYPAVGVAERMGDGIAFAYDIVQRSRGTPYELSLIRLFASDSSSPGTTGSRLRLSIGFSWGDAVKWFAQPDFGLPIGSSSLVWDKESAASFLSELRDHSVFKVLSQQEPKSVELRYEPIWDVRG